MELTSYEISKKLKDFKLHNSKFAYVKNFNEDKREIIFVDEFSTDKYYEEWVDAFDLNTIIKNLPQSELKIIILDDERPKIICCTINEKLYYLLSEPNETLVDLAARLFLTIKGE